MIDFFKEINKLSDFKIIKISDSSSSKNEPFGKWKIFSHFLKAIFNLNKFNIKKLNSFCFVSFLILGIVVFFLFKNKNKTKNPFHSCTIYTF